MAAQIFNTLGKLGIGLAVVGGVANSALYNGKEFFALGSACQLCPSTLERKRYF